VRELPPAAKEDVKAAAKKSAKEGEEEK